MAGKVHGGDEVAERDADLSDAARRVGRRRAADRYLLLAWAAFEYADLRESDWDVVDTSRSAQILTFPPRR